MKIRGRFIAILAVLGLLMVLLPLAPAGAAVGDLTIVGGADREGVYFSDKADFNVLEIAVEDSDLSPARVGRARYSTFSGRLARLNDGVVAGEMKIAEKLDGGLMNPICIDSEAAAVGEVAGKGILDRPWGYSSAGEVIDTDTGEMPAACAPQGDVLLGAGANRAYVDDATTDETDETDDNIYTVTLKETLRDSDDDGDVEADDVTVRLDNDELEEGITTGFAMGPALTDKGFGVDTILLNGEPRDPNAASVDDENLVIEYEYSEYKFDTTTPIRIAGTQVSSGADIDTATNEKQIDGVNSTTAVVTTTSDVGDPYVIVTFVYNVEDKESKFATVSSSTSQARNLNRVLDGYESSPRSDLFESSVLLVTHDDFTAIDSIAEDTTYADDEETVRVSDLDESNLGGDKDLADRIADAVGELDRIEMTSKATDLVARLLVVAHGDTISVTYRDASVAFPREALSRRPKWTWRRPL